ncbi:hypothetical protein FACS189440_02290 [Bacteroidia bacterium]|nr:hypothetical protein FACS189423_02020 [Bacteroidia bacterium]GHT45727.1 hypothetical protein FACS189440_02290 [Bacteroidia bacterium]
MKKILLSLFMLSAMTWAVSAQNVQKASHEATKKESSEGKKEKKESCCTEKKADSKDKKEATAETKSCGKK